jgi:sec-independent protein translocase protein TatB
MLDVGWTELLVIGALALIVVGPRDLPHLLRQVGRWVGQIKRMAREFQRSMEDAARETDLTNMKELRDLRKDIGGLDFRQQAAKAQSYLKQPVKVEPAAGAKPAQPVAAPDSIADAPPAGTTPEAGASAPAASAASPPASSAATPAAAVGGGERPSPGGDASGAEVSGEKVSGAKVSGK